MAFWIGGIGVLQGVAELRFAIANERGHRPTLYHSDGVLGSLCWGGEVILRAEIESAAPFEITDDRSLYAFDGKSIRFGLNGSSLARGNSEMNFKVYGTDGRMVYDESRVVDVCGFLIHSIEIGPVRVATTRNLTTSYYDHWYHRLWVR